MKVSRVFTLEVDGRPILAFEVEGARITFACRGKVKLNERRISATTGGSSRGGGGICPTAHFRCHQVLRVLNGRYA